MTQVYDPIKASTHGSNDSGIQEKSAKMAVPYREIKEAIENRLKRAERSKKLAGIKVTEQLEAFIVCWLRSRSPSPHHTRHVELDNPHRPLRIARLHYWRRSCFDR